MVLAIASQSKAIVLSLRKKKVVALDASVTSSGAIPISVLIKNVDMEDLIKVYQLAQKYNPIYICIQEFLTRVSLHPIFLLCFHCLLHFASHII